MGQYPDPMEMLRGVQVLPAGDAPWIPDSAKMYFGDDKDTYIWFNPATGYLELHGVASVLAGLQLAAGDDITCEAGDSKFDMSLGTGVFKTPSGAHTLAGDVTITSGKKLTKGVTLERSLSKTADYVITDTDPDLVFVGALSAHATLTLPTAADNAGRTICVVVAGDPGAYNVIVDGEGSETINGATTKTNSDQYSVLKVTCNGTGWYITGSIGTWT
jgi:hypothetical protein